MTFQVPPAMPQRPPLQGQTGERSALQKVVWFGILQLVGLVSGWVLGFYVFGTVFSNPASFNLPPNPTPAQVSTALGPVFQGLSLEVPVTLVIELVAIVVLIMALREFRTFDKDHFSLPSNLMIVELVGVVIAAVGVIPLFNGIPNIIAQAPATQGTAPSAAFAKAITSLLVDILALAVGGLLGLIGLIGGQILGLWRVGTRYDETIIKLGAIFVVIPLLNIVSPILLLVGAYQVRARISGPA